MGRATSPASTGPVRHRKNAETPILQLHDLEGDIVATVVDNEPKPNSSQHTTPPSSAYRRTANRQQNTPGSALGGLATEQSSGVPPTQGGSSYVTQLGRPLQTQPVEAPGSLRERLLRWNAIHHRNLSPSHNAGQQLGAGAPEREAARQAAAKQHEEEEERRAKERAELEARMDGPTPAQGGAEEVDPEIFLSKGAAIAVITVLEHTEEASEVVDKLGKYLGPLAEPRPRPAWSSSVGSWPTRSPPGCRTARQSASARPPICSSMIDASSLCTSSTMSYRSIGVWKRAGGQEKRWTITARAIR